MNHITRPYRRAKDDVIAHGEAGQSNDLSVRVTGHPVKLWNGISVCAALVAVFAVAAPAYAGNVTPAHRTVLTPGQYACTLANPQYTVYARGSKVVLHEHANKFDMNASYQQWANSYLITGYNPASYNSQSCDAYGYGRAQPLPLPVSKAGPLTTSIHLRTRGDFTGDGGYDVWLTRSPAAHSYQDMTSSPDNTELMVWVEHPGIGIGDYYCGISVAHNVHVDGRNWDILHAGRTRWHRWEYLVFATEGVNRGDFTMRNIHLGTLIRWGVAHGYVKRGDTIQAIDAGFEGHALAGGASVRGYRLALTARHRAGGRVAIRDRAPRGDERGRPETGSHRDTAARRWLSRAG